MFWCAHFAVSGISLARVGLRIPFFLYMDKEMLSYCTPVQAIGALRKTVYKLYSKTCDETKRPGSQSMAPQEES